MSTGPLIALESGEVEMLQRLEPLRNGRDTEIDMIEREMEGGVVVIQPADTHEHDVEDRVVELVRVEKYVYVREL
jgi:hypothetical protein